MISDLAQKLTKTSRTVWEEKRCLRNRLRGYSCRRCVASCHSQALEDNCGKIKFYPSRCTNCGVCATSCPGGAFSFEGFNLKKALQEREKGRSLVISCYGCSSRSENELRLPCVGILPPESVVYLGLRHRGDVFFNLAECSECINRGAADRFMQMFRLVQKRVGHLFHTRLVPVRGSNELLPKEQHDRRKFLLSLGGSVVDVAREQFNTGEGTQEEKRGTRWIPARKHLLLNLLSRLDTERETVLEVCTPYVEVSSSCTRCPRCTGMCPTGALKMRKDGAKKVLLYDRALCTACGLCVEFCREKAISIQKADIVDLYQLVGENQTLCR